ncbi:MAG: hypothetical protein ACI4VM_01860, partial [Anaerovoracaceae bacterium]
QNGTAKQEKSDDFSCGGASRKAKTSVAGLSKIRVPKGAGIFSFSERKASQTGQRREQSILLFHIRKSFATGGASRLSAVRDAGFVKKQATK